MKVLPQIPNASGDSYDIGTRAEIADGASNSYTRYDMNNQYQSVNLYTNYSFSLADKHNFTAMLGYQEESYKYRYLYDSVTDILSTSNPSLEWQW